MTESADNTWIDEEPDTAMVYAEIMAEAVKNSRTIALQSELIWILKLSGLTYGVIITPIYYYFFFLLKSYSY